MVNVWSSRLDQNAKRDVAWQAFVKLMNDSQTVSNK